MADEQTKQPQGQLQVPPLAEVLAAAAAFLTQQIRASQNVKQSVGFSGTTEGKLSMAIVILGAVLLLVGAMAPLDPAIAAKLMNVAEQLLTYVPIGYALSRGVAKVGITGANKSADDTGDKR